MEKQKDGCFFRKISRNSSETSVNIFKHQNKTPSPYGQMVMVVYLFQKSRLDIQQIFKHGVRNLDIHKTI